MQRYGETLDMENTLKETILTLYFLGLILQNSFGQGGGGHKGPLFQTWKKTLCSCDPTVDFIKFPHYLAIR